MLIIALFRPCLSQTYARTGIYVGGALPYHTIEGSFDGVTYQSGGGEVIALPRIKSSLGLGFVVCPLISATPVKGRC